ncbi:hypothetical protein BgiMline_026728, partial [Biomphalaria glabrata]
FIQCMSENDSESCYIYTENWHSIGDKVEKKRGIISNYTPIYSCTLNYCVLECEYKYVQCLRNLRSVCYNYNQCNLQTSFYIKWPYQDNYLEDTNLLQCQYSSKCTSYANILTTTVSTATTSFSSTTAFKTTPTTSWQYEASTVSTEWKNMTANNRSSLENFNYSNSSGSASNTTIIIVAVIVSLCVVIAAVVVVYCVRKRYRSKNNSGTNMYANDPTFNNKHIFATNSFTSPTLETITDNRNDDQSFQNRHIKNTYEDYEDISSNSNGYEIVENSKNNKTIQVDDGVYLNTNSLDLINKPYARLGEQVRVNKHDYNFLLPEEHGGTQLDTLTVPEEINVNVTTTEHTDYNLAQDALSTTDTSTNTYSLAKVVRP